MSSLADIVVERPDPTLQRQTVCPLCGSDNVDELGETQTLAGSNNHHWIRCICFSCKEAFSHEFTAGDERFGIKPNHWYTKNGKVLRGAPTCFESYTYTCEHCGGDVKRHYFHLDEDVEVEVLITEYVGGKSVKKYRTIFECGKCGASVKSDDEYFLVEREWK